MTELAASVSQCAPRSRGREMICLVSRSARKLRPEPMRPSKASRYQTSRVQRAWSLSHGGVHETASRSPRYVGRDGEDATSFWYSSQVWTRPTAVVASRDATVRRHAEVSRQRPIVPARRQLDLVGLVGGEAVEVGDVELGVLVALGDLLEPVVERLVAGLERVLAVVAVDRAGRGSATAAGGPSRRSRSRRRSRGGSAGSGGSAAATRVAAPSSESRP